MADSIYGAAAEKSLWGACGIINKLTRLGVLNTTNVQAATTVDDLIARAYAALQSTSGGYEMFGRHVREEVWMLEQFLNRGRKIGIFGIGTTAQNATIAGLLTVNTAAAGTDLRFCFSTAITQPGFDATTSEDPHATMGMAYQVTAG